MNWIQYIKTSENQALKEIYKQHRRACMSWLQGTFHVSVDDAKEIFQSSVIALYDNVISGRLVELEGSLKTYLYGIARNKYREFRRESTKKVDKDKLSRQSNSKGIEEKIILELRINHVDAVLQSMGNPCKKLLQLYYYKRKSMSEISDRMGYKNSDTVKNQKYKCIKRLQKLINHHITIEDDIES